RTAPVPLRSWVTDETKRIVIQLWRGRRAISRFQISLRSPVALRDLSDRAVRHFLAFRILLRGARLLQRCLVRRAGQSRERPEGLEPNGFLRILDQLEQRRSHPSAHRLACRQTPRRGDAGTG